MENIYLKKVETKREMSDFVRFAGQLYAGCQYYVPDLDMDVIDSFNPSKNAGLEYSEIQPFIAYNATGKTVGRIAGIINHRANEKWKTKNVRFGFIEFVDDLEVSAALLKAVEQWGKERGMDCIQGPMGIFDFDKEGMLIEDFDKLGSMITIYNYPYYPKHMEALGYEKEVDWVQVAIEIPKDIPSKYVRVSKQVKEMFGLHVKKLTNADVSKRGYGKKVFNLLNMAYAPLFGYTELSDKQIDLYIKRYLPLIDKQLLPVIENEDGEVVGAAITMGSLSRALQKTKGKLFPFGWYYMLRALMWKREDTAELLLIAVRPDYQGLGVNALFFEDLIPIYNKCHFKRAETGPQLENNVKELSQWKPLNPTFIKRRRCYKKKL
ncbi:N-acetyltransferase [uncultured Parabacteroides sp.]|uniref:N-acetyltransferase n=1 Tax=uncultured Parabacteroides sp. TaxID=512312 RepID=UPI0025FEF2C7|nr:N-acetyltransferase [uncultured Parabacteroides sp.]